MNIYLILFSLCLYCFSVKFIGLPMAKLAWSIWDKNEIGHKWAFFLFPLHKTFDRIGQDYFGVLADPIIPIVACHGRFSGNGFGVLDANPIGKGVYIVHASVFWLPTAMLNIAIILFIKIIEWGIIVPVKFLSQKIYLFFLKFV